MTCVNDALAKPFRKSKTRPPIVAFSKLDLDFALNGAKCETMIPVRDTIKVTNSGGAPIELRFECFDRPAVSLKFVPAALTLAAGESTDVHVTIIFLQVPRFSLLVVFAFA